MDTTGLRKLNIWHALFVLSLVLYSAAGWYQLDLPGLYYDEALDAVPAMQFLQGQPLETEATVDLGGRSWPLMLMPYVGSTTTYLSMVAFALLGPGATALRLANWLVGLVALVLSWGFLREYLDERVAALSTLLLAANPTFVFWTRMGAFVSLPMLPLAIGTVWALYRWYRRGQGVYLILAGLLMGLGITTKLLFAWLMIGLGAAWLLLSPFLRPGRGWRAWLWPLELGTWQSWLGGLLAFGLGLSPVLIYNLRGLGTVQFVVNTFNRERPLADTAGLLSTMLQVARRDFGYLLDGGWFGTRLGERQVNRIAAPAFAAGLAVLVGLGIAGRLSYSAKKLALLLILMVAVVVQSALMAMGRGADHLLIAWPWPQALVAAALFSLWDSARQRFPQQRAGLAVALALAGFVLVGAELATTMGYHRALAASGGGGYFSDAIDDLAADLLREDAPRVVALDWGFKRNLQILTEGRVNPEEVFSYTSPPGPEVEALLEPLLDEADALILVHPPWLTVLPGHWEALQRAAHRRGLEPVLWKSYHQRTGELVFQVYRLGRAPALAGLPEEATPLRVRLGDDIQLLGYSLPSTQVQPGETLEPVLYWQALAQPADSYKVFVHLVDDTGRLWAQHDAVPRAWGHPTTAWQAGEVVEDRIQVPVPADMTPGIYHLLAGMYREDGGERLPVIQEGQAPGDSVWLADVTVP